MLDILEMISYLTNNNGISSSTVMLFLWEEQEHYSSGSCGAVFHHTAHAAPVIACYTPERSTLSTALNELHYICIKELHLCLRGKMQIQLWCH